jgi:TRAP-type mannitol/chloroaromatic compound transport system substrate-binding protein
VRVRRPAQSNASRRKFLAAVTTTTAAITGFPMIAVAQAPAVLRFQSAWPARDVFHEYALDYARKFNDMSGGRIRIEVQSASAGVKPPDLLDAVDKGQLDGCHAVPANWARKDSSFLLFGSGPAFGMSADQLLSWLDHGGGRALYEELLARVLNLNVTGFLYGPMPAQPLGWFRQPLSSAAQLKGMRVHARGAAGQIMSAMGAAVQDLPDEEIVAAARARRLDAVVYRNLTSDRTLGLHEVFPVCMMQSYHQPAQVFEILFNRKRLDALPADLRAIVRYAAQAASADLSWKATHRNSADYADMRLAPGVRFVTTPPGILRAQLKAWNGIAARSFNESPYFERVFKSQQVWARRTVSWSLDARVDARLAYDHWFAQPDKGRGPA